MWWLVLLVSSEQQHLSLDVSSDESFSEHPPGRTKTMLVFHMYYNTSHDFRAGFSFQLKHKYDDVDDFCCLYVWRTLFVELDFSAASFLTDCSGTF